MVHPVDVPKVEPRWCARPITPNEIVQVASGPSRDVSGLDLDDPRVQAIQRSALGSLSRLAFNDARRQGWLFVNRGIFHEDEEERLIGLWRWWCAAARHPEIVVRQVSGANGARLRCDQSSTGRSWDLYALLSIVPMLRNVYPVPGSSWIFTPDLLEIDGLCSEDAISLARRLRGKASSRRYGAFQTAV